MNIVICKNGLHALVTKVIKEAVEMKSYKETINLIKADIDRYVTNPDYTRYKLTKRSYVHKFLFLFFREQRHCFRVIFYHRIGRWARLVRWIFRPPFNTTRINCPNVVGGGIFFAHAWGTVLNCEHIGYGCAFLQNTTFGAKPRNGKLCRPYLEGNVLVGANAVVIGGGGLFLPDTNKNSVSGWQWSYSPEQLTSINKPIILFSIGYNYFRDQEPDELFVNSLRDLVKKSRFVGLRNHGSIRAIQNLLPCEMKEKIIYQPCLTTLISRIGYDLAQKTINKKVAINIAFDRMEQRLGTDKDTILEEIADAIKIIEKKGYEIYYIAHISKDLSFVNYLHEKDVNVKIVCASSWSAKRLIAFYRNMDVVIGMRGHAQMIPFGVGTHIITLGSHDKMRWFLEDIESEDWYIELTENPHQLGERIVHKFADIHEKHSSETTERILESQDMLFNITKDNFDIINELIMQ